MATSAALAIQRSAARTGRNFCFAIRPNALSIPSTEDAYAWLIPLMQRITVTNVAAEITYLRNPVFVLNNHNGARPKIAAKDRYALSLVPMISAKLDNTIFPKYQSILFWFFSCVNRTIETAKSAAT